jgi:hypothetical protein
VRPVEVFAWFLVAIVVLLVLSYVYPEVFL